ncbi:MAG: acetate kinase, partial [Candidatus Aegiribacteria sp.]|nr:acetate kinase [Candidatus Aegiribacteria sp.]
MKILVINSGSSSIKFKLIDMENENLLAEGLIERIGLPEGRIKYKSGGKTIILEEPVPDHKKGVNFVLDALTNSEYGPIENYSEIGAVGHRVVHGGERF